MLTVQWFSLVVAKKCWQYKGFRWSVLKNADRTMVFKDPFGKNADSTMVFAGRYYNKLTVQRFRLKSPGFLGKDFQAYSLPPNPATHRPEPVLCYYCASVAIWAQTSFDQACSTRLSLVPVHVRAFTPSLSPVSPFTLSLSPV